MSDDDLLLDASDLADIFGGDDAKGGDDFAKSIEDLFLSDDDDDEPSAPAIEPARAVAVAPPPPPPRSKPLPLPPRLLSRSWWKRSPSRRSLTARA